VTATAESNLNTYGYQDINEIKSKVQVLYNITIMGHSTASIIQANCDRGSGANSIFRITNHSEAYYDQILYLI
jgi:hypothetical protein